MIVDYECIEEKKKISMRERCSITSVASDTLRRFLSLCRIDGQEKAYIHKVKLEPSRRTLHY